MSWRNKAVCFDHVVNQRRTDYWEKIISDQYGAAHVAEAKRICSDCPVKKECLIEALEMHDTFGIRGGFTPRERQKLTPSMV